MLFMDTLIVIYLLTVLSEEDRTTATSTCTLNLVKSGGVFLR